MTDTNNAGMRHVNRHPDAESLLFAGPLVQAFIGPRWATAKDFAEQRPEIQPVTLLVDTGADVTLVDLDVIERVGVPPSRFENICGLDRTISRHPMFFLRVAIAMADDQGRTKLAAMQNDVVGMSRDQEAAVLDPGDAPWVFENENHQGLLGRDFLQFCQLTYYGRRGVVELAIDSAVDELS